MAMIDYGSVVKKNGKIIQKEMFMDMKEAVGFEIDSLQEGIEGKTLIDGDWFSYMGDEELLVCTYKTQVLIVSNNEIKKHVWYGTLDGNWRLPFPKYQLQFEVNGTKFHIKKLFNQNRYKLRFEYKNDLYECLYGYGVDVDKNIWYNVTPKERRYIDKWFNENK